MVLGAVYGSAVPEFCDVENVLLYNVGASSFAAIAAAGIRVERSDVCPAPPVPLAGVARHYFRYVPCSAADASRPGHAGASREQLMAQLERLRADLRGVDREQDDDLVLEVMDFVSGWCSPHMRT